MKKRRSKFSISILIGYGVIIFFLYDCSKLLIVSVQKKNAFSKETIKTKAVVINKKNFFGNNPVTQAFAYSYKFEVNGIQYEGNTWDSDYRVGDSVLIEYSPENPEFHRLMK
jgi:hypothetical protein